MQQDEITEIFDKHAAIYDEQWEKLSPLYDALHVLTASALHRLPETSKILCVGAGTGAELLFLARRFPKWRFTAVEPSTEMAAIMRRKAKEHGILARCHVHNGYIETLPPDEKFDAATSFLVAQFIADRKLRTHYFRDTAARLIDGGILVCADLAADRSDDRYDGMLRNWLHLMKGNGVSTSDLARVREAYRHDVSVITPIDIESILIDAGFCPPVPFFQAGLIHGWYARRSPAPAAEVQPVQS